MPIFLTDHLTIILGDTMADRVEGEEEEEKKIVKPRYYLTLSFISVLLSCYIVHVLSNTLSLLCIFALAALSH